MKNRTLFEKKNLVIPVDKLIIDILTTIDF